MSLLTSSLSPSSPLLGTTRHDAPVGDLSNATVASVSFGYPRVFSVRPKAAATAAGAAAGWIPTTTFPSSTSSSSSSLSSVTEVLLEPGSLLVMGGAFQEKWQHALLPTPPQEGSWEEEKGGPHGGVVRDQKQQGRINLTFRRVEFPDRGPTKARWDS